MRLFEYQAKDIFQKHGIPIPKSQVISNAALADQVREEIGERVVLKAQLLIRGRAKIGGIQLVHPKEDIVDSASKIFGLSIKGQKVRKILIEEAIEIEQEYVIKLEIDPNLEKPVFIASKFDIKKSLSNGMEATENRIRIPIELSIGLLEFQIRKIAVALEVKKELWEKFSSILIGMWNIFKGLDAERIEINPLVTNDHNQFFALGAIIEVEDQALFRQAAILDRRESVNGSALTKEAEKYGISLSQNEGNIGCIVNGDALGYAVKDMVVSLGGNPGVFLNIGGGAGDEKISAGLQILFKNKRTDCILVVIFGGITRCDRVASGIIRALKSKTRINHLVIYLNGTNSNEGITLLKNSGVVTEDSLLKAVKKCIEIIKETKP
jgi:succinyl-CoA synthetase beta subunit